MRTKVLENSRRSL